MFKRCLLAAVVSVCAAAAQAATINNGSFESPIVPAGNFAAYSPGSGMLDNWTIAGKNIDHIGAGYWQASDGVQSLDLNGSQGAGATVSQLISGLIFGKAYKVLFDMAGNTEGPPRIVSMDVQVGGSAAQSYSFDTDGQTRRNMGWTTMAYSFTAGASSLLTFTSTTTNGCCWGAALDNVRIVGTVPVIPLPAGGALLLTALGMLMLRRRRR